MQDTKLKMKEFESLRGFFEYLNEEINDYVILRGVEEFENFFDWNAEKDIDIMCEDTKKCVEYIGAMPLFEKDDRKHYKIFVAGKRVVIDFNTIGDGEFDEKWVREMITCREKNSVYSCYVLSDEDYKYSLIYHGLVHKGAISEKYKRLSGIYFDTMEQYDKLLWEFMKEKKYKYVVNKGEEFKYYWEYIHSECTSFMVRCMMIKRNLNKVLKRQIKFLKDIFK